MTTSSEPPDPGDDAAPGRPARGRLWLESLFADHHRQVRRYAARRVGPDDADDITSEVFATAWRRRDDVPEFALPWLYNAAAHHIRHSRRGEARRGRLASRALVLAGREHGDDTLADVDSALDDHARVRSVLDHLGEDDAEILRLSAWEQLDPADIALVLGCAPGTARVRLHRARRRAERVLARLEARPARPTTSAPYARTCQGES